MLLHQPAASTREGQLLKKLQVTKKVLKNKSYWMQA